MGPGTPRALGGGRGPQMVNERVQDNANWNNWMVLHREGDLSLHQLGSISKEDSEKG